MYRNQLVLTTVAFAVVIGLPALAAHRTNVKLGVSHYGNPVGAGDGAEVLLYEDTDTSQLSVTVWLDTAGPLLGDFYGYSSAGPDGTGQLPLGADRVDELAGRVFEIVDAHGTLVVSSKLPMVRGRKSETVDGTFVRGGAPFRLRIADRKGILQEIAELQPLLQQ